MNRNDQENIMMPEEVAELLKVTVGTLENWRSAKAGPQYYRPAKQVYYLRSDVAKWILSAPHNVPDDASSH